MRVLKTIYQNRFCLRKLQSPTYYNLDKYLQSLGWFPTRYKWYSHFNEQHFQFNTLAAEQLEFKHLLANLVEQYCSDIMPETYNINDQNWPSVLHKIAQKYYTHRQLLDKNEELAWILKPALLNNGQYIKVFQRLSEIRNHYQSTNRLGGEHVLQHYIMQPHLLRGHKYSIRMFVVITNYVGAYLYPHGYFNVAQHRYKAHEFSDLRPHITNEHLNDDESNVIQIPSHRMDIFASLYPQIKNMIMKTVNALKSMYPEAFISKTRRSLAIFGFDFIVDVSMRPWLIEANHGPCFPTNDTHPLQSYLYNEFWQSLIESFVVPIAKKLPIEDIQYQAFELIDDA